MRVVLFVAVSFVSILRADEVADRRSIDSVIEGLNDPLQRAGLFAENADSAVDFDSLIDLQLALPARVPVSFGAPEPRRMLTEPHVVSDTIHFVTPDVAIVDGASVVRGAVTSSEQSHCCSSWRGDRLAGVSALFGGSAQRLKRIALDKKGKRDEDR